MTFWQKLLVWRHNRRRPHDMPPLCYTCGRFKTYDFGCWDQGGWSCKPCRTLRHRIREAREREINALVEVHNAKIDALSPHS